MATKLSAKAVAESSAIHRLIELDKVPWYRKKNLRYLYLFLIPSALGVEMTNGYDGTVLNGLQSVQKWLDYFDNPQGAILGITSAALAFGGVVGLPFVPWFNDRFGRKICIVFGSIIAAIGIIIQTTAVNLPVFIVARAIIGVGVPFAISGASQLLAELCYPKERPVITALFNDCMYAGSILAAGVTLGTYSWKTNWAWRLPSLFQILPSVLQLSFIWFVPESPRWLVSKERHEEAFEILVKYHGEGDRENELVLAEFAQIRDTIRLEMEASKRPYTELFQGSNRRRVLVASLFGLFSQWSGNGLILYYLAKILSSIGITDRATQNKINLGLTSWNLVAAAAGSFATHFMTRRKQFLSTFVGMTVVFAAWTGASATYAKDSTNNASAKAVVALIFIFNGLYGFMIPLLYLYITEVFPFIHRSQGIAITQFFARAGSAFNQFVNPIALKNIGWHYYIVYVAWLAIETGTIFFVFPETKGPSLEEVALVVDGENAHVARGEVDRKTIREDEAVDLQEKGPNAA